MLNGGSPDLAVFAALGSALEGRCRDHKMSLKAHFAVRRQKWSKIEILIIFGKMINFKIGFDQR